MLQYYSKSLTIAPWMEFLTRQCRDLGLSDLGRLTPVTPLATACSTLAQHWRQCVQRIQSARAALIGPFPVAEPQHKAEPLLGVELPAEIREFRVHLNYAATPNARVWKWTSYAVILNAEKWVFTLRVKEERKKIIYTRRERFSRYCTFQAYDLKNHRKITFCPVLETESCNIILYMRWKSLLV